MCIIICKPKGKKLTITIESHLKNAFSNNSDGFGYMYNDGNRVHIKKGFMTWSAVKKEIPFMRRISKDSDMVFHARWATHGTISKGNTHPFPLSSNSEDLKATTITCGFGIAHNGVISECGSDGKGGEFSDTQIFIRDYLTNIPQKLLMDDTTCNLIRMATSSRFAFLTPTKMKTIGDFISEKNGCFYSNSDYKPYVMTRYVNRYGYGIGHYDDTYNSTKNNTQALISTPWYQKSCIICGSKDYFGAKWFHGEMLCVDCSPFYDYCEECGEVVGKDEMSKYQGICDTCYALYWDNYLDVDINGGNKEGGKVK